MLEERNAIAVFSRPEIAVNLEAPSFFQVIGRTPFSSAQGRVTIEEADDGSFPIEARMGKNHRRGADAQIIDEVAIRTDEAHNVYQNNFQCRRSHMCSIRSSFNKN